MQSARSSCEIFMTLDFFLDRFSENTQISNFMKIHLVGADLFHADGRTWRHDESDSHFSRFCEGS